MHIRRIVTGHNSDGRSVFVSDGLPPRERAMEHTPGFVSSPLWQLQGTPEAGKTIADPTIEMTSLLAGPGGATFLVVTFPPDSVFMSPDFNPELAGAENLASSPGIADRFEPDNPGMHTTPTVDFGTVIEGTIVLELDDGAAVTLSRGDTIVQQGTRHAWRNPGDVPATISFVMIGATRP